MGNKIELIKNKDTILWIDANVYNSENKKTYQYYLPKLKNFNFICFTSEKKAINFIKDNKYFEYRLFYVVISGKLAENYFNEYVKLTEKKSIIAATTVYCFNKPFHETKPYFKDKFLNPGGITFKFKDVYEYILKDECEWNEIPQRYKKYKPEKESFGNVFMNIDTSKNYELALPILIGKLINVSLLENEDISNFQKLLLSRYCQTTNSLTNYYIKPSGNKDINIPHHILAKYWLRLYTEEKPCFYLDLNKDLTNDKFDDYHPFIFLLYDSLNKGLLLSYRKNRLFRIGNISNNEFEEMKNNYYSAKKDQSLKPFYYSKNFLSFSKDIKKAKKFIKNKENCTTILFIIEKPKKEKFFITNIDIESFSAFKKEKEVLFLPLSCFEIIDISEEKNYNKSKYIEVRLKYLEEYEKEINDEIEKIKGTENEINKFFENSLKSKYGENIQKYYNKKEKLIIKYCQYINASPKNNYFLNKIGTLFNNKIKKCLTKGSKEASINVDDEIPNAIEENYDNFEGEIHIDDEINNISKENKIKKFFKNLFGSLDNLRIDQSYSIGICLGNFLYNWDSFLKAPTQANAANLALLALAMGLPIIKLIPKIKEKMNTKAFCLDTTNINIASLLNGLNILAAVIMEGYAIFSFSYEHKLNITLKYGFKRGIKLLSGIGVSFLGNLAAKGILVIFGVTLAPGVTIVLGIISGIAFGYLGAKIGDELSDKLWGKDEFVLKSDHLYFKYIPLKYRKRYYNPNLKWNKTYLSTNVKSYVIECIIDETDLIMLLINIPKDVYEIDECLGFNKNNNNYIEDDNYIEYFEKETKIYKEGQFIGDLIIPYQGIKDNCFSINFIIYGINQDKIDNKKDWLDYKEKGKNIEILFNLSVY